MLETTLDIIKSGLRADPTISPQQRANLLTLMRRGEGPPKTEMPKPAAPRVLTRRATAQALDRSLRLVDRLAKEGVLQKVRLPGRQRAIGFLADDVHRLLSESLTEKEAELKPKTKEPPRRCQREGPEKLNARTVTSPASTVNSVCVQEGELCHGS
jgi:hypothetical protein